MSNPFRVALQSNKNRDLLDAFVIDKSLFYSLCGQANKICAIEYDKITLYDLLHFVALDCKNTFIQTKVNERAEAEIKKEQTARKMGVRRR